MYKHLLCTFCVAHRRHKDIQPQISYTCKAVAWDLIVKSATTRTLRLELAKIIYIRRLYGLHSSLFPLYTAYIYIYIRFWPTLLNEHFCVAQRGDKYTCMHRISRTCKAVAWDLIAKSATTRLLRARASSASTTFLRSCVCMYVMCVCMCVCVIQKELFVFVCVCVCVCVCAYKHIKNNFGARVATKHALCLCNNAH